MDTTKIYRYPNNDMDRHKLWVRFKRVDFEWDDTKGQMQAVEGPNQPVVYMYLPGSIELKDGSSYSTANLGILGRAAEAGINEFGTRTDDPLRRISQAADIFAGAVVDTVDTVGDIAGGAALNQGMVALLLHRFNQGSSGIGGGVRAATRAIANPHSRAMFENVNLRNFSFSFELIPDSALDARQQEDIIKFFRKIAYPSLLNINPNDAAEASGNQFTERMADQLVYKFPSMVAVDMFYYMDPEQMRGLSLHDLTQNDRSLVEDTLSNRGQDADLVMNHGLWRIGPRIKPCYITDVSQTLDNNNSLMYRPIEQEDGTRRAIPTTQTLTISLQEDRPLSAESIDAGY